MYSQRPTTAAPATLEENVPHPARPKEAMTLEQSSVSPPAPTLAENAPAAVITSTLEETPLAPRHATRLDETVCEENSPAPRPATTLETTVCENSPAPRPATKLDETVEENSPAPRQATTLDESTCASPAPRPATNLDASTVQDLPLESPPLHAILQSGSAHRQLRHPFERQQW